MWQKISRYIYTIGFFLFCQAFYFVFLRGGLTGKTLYEKFAVSVVLKVEHLKSLVEVFIFNNPSTFSLFFVLLFCFIGGFLITVDILSRG